MLSELASPRYVSSQEVRELVPFWKDGDLCFFPYENLSMEFVKYMHKNFKRLFCHYMKVKYITILINNISDNFLLLDNEMEL